MDAGPGVFSTPRAKDSLGTAQHLVSVLCVGVATTVGVSVPGTACIDSYLPLGVPVHCAPCHVIASSRLGNQTRLADPAGQLLRRRVRKCSSARRCLRSQLVPKLARRMVPVQVAHPPVLPRAVLRQPVVATSSMKRRVAMKLPRSAQRRVCSKRQSLLRLPTTTIGASGLSPAPECLTRSCCGGRPPLC